MPIVIAPPPPNASPSGPPSVCRPSPPSQASRVAVFGDGCGSLGTSNGERTRRATHSAAPGPSDAFALRYGSVTSTRRLAPGRRRCTSRDQRVGKRRYRRSGASSTRRFVAIGSGDRAGHAADIGGLTP